MALLYSSSASAADWSEIYSRLNWSGTPIPRHRFEIIAGACPEVLSFANDPANVFITMDNAFVQIRDYYRVDPKSGDWFYLNYGVGTYLVSRIITASEQRLVQLSIGSIPHVEKLFIRFYFDDQTQFETDIVAQGDEWLVMFNPIILIQADAEIKKRLASGVRITEIELVHPHLVEAFFIRNSTGIFPAVAYPQGADEQVVHHVSHWLNGFLISEESGIQKAIPYSKVNLPKGVESAMEALRSWHAKDARVTVTAVVGVHPANLVKISTHIAPSIHMESHD